MDLLYPNCSSVAIGDSENDLSMLGSAKYGYLVKRYDGSYVDTSLSGVVYCKNIGPLGFTEMVKEIVYG